MTRLCVSRTSRLVIGMVLIVLGVTQPSWVEVVNADGEGWYSSWQLRKAITIDATKVSSGPHTNFPVLVNLSSDASLASRAQSDGDDILFTSSDGATKLSHEIEKYGSSTGELIAWVKVPSLPSTSNTVLYMYYGNDAVASQQDATNVWDSNYKGVWHLKESGDHIGNDYLDSTTNANHGIGGSGTASAVPTQIAGKIGNANDFDGTDDYINFGSGASLDISGSVITLSMWVNADAIGTQWHTIDRYPCYFIDILANAKYYFSTNDNPTVTGATSVTAGTWRHVVGVKTTTQLLLYLGGTQDGVTASALALNDTCTGTILGKFSGGGYQFNGKFDEVRISNIDRSAGWILTEYNNQGTPTTFYAVGQPHPHQLIF